MSRPNKKIGIAIYHVTPKISAETWIVSREKGKLTKEFDTKQEAEKFAKHRAGLNQLSQVKVHGADGNIEYQSTYGEYPGNIPGQ